MKPVILLLLTASFATAAIEALEIHPRPEAVMKLTVEKTGLLRGKKHLFTFSRYSGALVFNRASPELSSITLSIDSASIMCQDTWLSAKDLRKVQEYAAGEMLAVRTYPQIKFRSTSIRKVAPDRYEAEGMLIIRNISKAITVVATTREESEGLLSVEGEATIRLTDFGLKPPTAALGTIGTKNEMSFRFSIALKRQREISGTAE
jgi:polyisoprenoid-binding protein YceI